MCDKEKKIENKKRYNEHNPVWTMKHFLGIFPIFCTKYFGRQNKITIFYWKWQSKKGPKTLLWWEIVQNKIKIHDFFHLEYKNIFLQLIYFL